MLMTFDYIGMAVLLHSLIILVIKHGPDAII